jgi:methylmalonyl-CoA mutase
MLRLAPGYSVNLETNVTQSRTRPAQSTTIRFVTATSLFDGHDAAINIMRRILQSRGVEVIHLGHNRSVREIVNAAIQEDVQGIAVSSYQGGHVEFFKYMIDMLKQNNATHIQVFGGGGGVIIPAEIRLLEEYGVTRIYAPSDGQALGLHGMIDDMIKRIQDGLKPLDSQTLERLSKDKDWLQLARTISALENEPVTESIHEEIAAYVAGLEASPPVLGITGTGGSGKSSLTDELIRRFQTQSPTPVKIAVLAIDPTRRKTGGALLGDRIRMNAINDPNIYMRSLATRKADAEVPAMLSEIIDVTRLAGFDLILIETPGIGQGNAGIVPFCDLSLYVMTPEFGAQSQLEKIDMLDFADFVAINKFDRKGAKDALRDVRKQIQRNRNAFDIPTEAMPVFGTIASHFNDQGVSTLYLALRDAIAEKGFPQTPASMHAEDPDNLDEPVVIVPPARQRYLSEIVETIRSYKSRANQQAHLVHELQQLSASREMLSTSGANKHDELEKLIHQKNLQIEPVCEALLDTWPDIEKSYQQAPSEEAQSSKLNQSDLTYVSLSGTSISRVALPKFRDRGDLLNWLMLENLPGFFPFTAGVFEFKRESEDPTRMFAGEGDAFRTNQRFKQLSKHTRAKRLSTAFDSVTLYGEDPAIRPDIYGKIGNAGVSICTVEDMMALYDGFDLCDPETSVSMTINGPAPIILAFYFQTAVRQQLTRFEQEKDRLPNAGERAQIETSTLERVRGTVQADILKEDQGQNTCLFSTEFSLKMMGDIQQYFVERNIRNFYSVSISGYHIAEAGANPISQLAFTLSNGFTYVESYLARGMNIDDFAGNLSFFFSNGMDPEYTVMGRVARRIWAIALRDKYGASKRSQRLKYHIQTSGRSLHAQEMSFNDIRTTLQALIAIYDNCNSLHTNAYDEAVTTPTEHSVRRALAIQLIINKEWGLAKNQNPNQGAFIIDELTELVEEAVLKEFERISERGGVLGAMETGYQRSKIQEESLLYEAKKHDGSLPIIGVNQFQSTDKSAALKPQLARSTEEEKQSQLSRLADFHERNKDKVESAIKAVQYAASNNENVFAALMEAVKYCSLGQLTHALFDVGGKYRRNM